MTRQPDISDESWKEFWRYIMDELREVRRRAYEKYPAHCKWLHKLQLSFTKGMRRKKHYTGERK